jgi:hypothetical protein
MNRRNINRDNYDDIYQDYLSKLKSETETDNDNQTVSLKYVKQVLAGAKANMDILKKKLIKEGVDNKVKTEVIEKMKKTIDVYKNRYERANAELEVLKNYH